jgi:abortive infection bacteriophage resistance protein
MRKYNKRFLNITEQVELLKSRGLIIDDEERLIFYLKHINYYHFSVYFKAFQGYDNNFRENTNFEDVFNIYNFDKKLRLLLLDVLERIEMSIKSALSYEITKEKNDLYWYLMEKYEYKKNYDKIKDIIVKSRTSRETYVRHFFDNYSDENLPAWFFFESLSFGACVSIIKGLDNSDKKVLSDFYGLSKKNFQMLHHLSVLRNSCAHHSWVWNKNFTLEVSKSPEYSDLFSCINTRSLYALIVFIQIFLARISPTSDWLDKLEELIEEYNIEIYRMSFPEDWKQRLEFISN